MSWGLTSSHSPLGSGIAHAGGRTPADAFQEIYTVFLVLGTAVGVVVILYLLYNMSSYRIRGGDEKRGTDTPGLGTLPSDPGGGTKLGISFVLSAVIVISLLVWTYGFFEDIEQGPDGVEQNVENAESYNGEDGDVLTVEVVGFQWGWKFVYPNGTETRTLYVPNDTAVRLQVTSEDVFHNFGISAYNMKTDAIPGQTTEMWFVPKETRKSTARCYELCGAGHSDMTAEVVVMEQSEFDEWYANQTAESEQNETTA
jgi:cytochrome c oxidase subunit 2